MFLLIHLPKRLLHIAILVSLFAFSFNLVVKCDGLAIVKTECHSDDCNESKDSNDDCIHCLILNNSILVTHQPIFFNSKSEVFYYSHQVHYEFQNINSPFRPPQA
jgi:hypothetical protein